MRSSILWAAIVAATVAVPVQAQTVYKCRGADGQTIFQQAPCTADLSAHRVDATPLNVVEGNPVGDMGVRAEAARNEQVRSAIARGAVLPGMTAGELQQSWGAPTRMSVTDTARGQHAQYVYRSRQGAQYVYTDNGLVTAVQTHWRR